MRSIFIPALIAGALLLGACGQAGTAQAPTAANAPATNAPAAGAIQISDPWARPAIAMMGDEQPAGASMGEAKPTDAMAAAQPTGAAVGGESAAMSGANGAPYLTITNTGDAADRLIKATGDIAKSIELHTVIKNGDVMEMRPVEAIEVPAKGSVKLMPGSFHVMLIGLNRDLKVGDSLDVTLQFEKAGAVPVHATVRQPE
ncbi:hypothetical protein SE17_19475 [Kouleothrix aurantiaca]|uniref:Copper chaperone PCu(A)C n=1 Tax=Kouleothrix aurantiaca TaxID=186479 RepID=A0A0P9DNP6_9CHLR|nr:hypothetical protein SE17_19475 [Kouleothrix aurantiaca]